MNQLQGIDLNLLLAFDALMAEHSVTRAAERMMVGQPAMSASLARLRKLFEDPLLVREGRVLVPTPVAESLIQPIRQALALMDTAVGTRRTFDASTDERTFTIMASDYVLVVLLRRLLAELSVEAPNVRINVRPIGDDHTDQLRRGLIDLFILPRVVERSKVALHTRDLFTDRLVCAVDRDHPTVGGVISLTEFTALPYLAYEGGAVSSVAEEQLRDRGVERSIDVSTQSFVVAPLLLRGTGYVTLVYERLGRLMEDQAQIRILEPPIELAPVTEVMFWSPRLEESAPHRWLRDRLVQTASSLG